jgi:hypothetical protein
MLRIGKRWIAVAALMAITTAVAWADASGKWTWKQRAGQDGNEVEMILELKQDGEKLTGTLMRAGADQKSEIREGTVKGADIAFVVVQMRGGQERRNSYKGKVEGDTIKGTRTGGGQNQEPREWTATRAK